MRAMLLVAVLAVAPGFAAEKADMVVFPKPTESDMPRVRFSICEAWTQHLPRTIIVTFGSVDSSTRQTIRFVLEDGRMRAEFVEQSSSSVANLDGTFPRSEAHKAFDDMAFVRKDGERLPLATESVDCRSLVGQGLRIRLRSTTIASSETW